MGESRSHLLQLAVKHNHYTDLLRVECPEKPIIPQGDPHDVERADQVLADLIVWL